MYPKSREWVHVIKVFSYFNKLLSLKLVEFFQPSLVMSGGCFFTPNIAHFYTIIKKKIALF